MGVNMLDLHWRPFNCESGVVIWGNLLTKVGAANRETATTRVVNRETATPAQQSFLLLLFLKLPTAMPPWSAFCTSMAIAQTLGPS